MESYSSTTDNHFNSSIHDEGVSYSNVPLNDENKSQYNITINNKDSRPIPQMPCSRERITIEQHVNVAPMLLLNLVAPDLVRSCNFDDIGVDKLFAELVNTRTAQSCLEG